MEEWLNETVRNHDTEVRNEFPSDHPLMRESEDKTELTSKDQIKEILNQESISEGSKQKILQLVGEIEEESEYRSRKISGLMDANRSLLYKNEDLKRRLTRATRSGQWNF